MQTEGMGYTSYVSVTLVYAAFGDFKELCYDADGSILAQGYVYILTRGLWPKDSVSDW